MKRLSLNILPGGTVRMPSRLRRIRISAVAVFYTVNAATDVLVLTVRDGGGNVAVRGVTPAPSVFGQIVASLAVNGSGTIATVVGLVDDTAGFLPPDLWIETEDSVTFSFTTAPTSVDGPIVVSYEEEE